MSRQASAMMHCDGELLFAWLPQLGPVLGWTRTDQQAGCPVGRMWAKADDVYTSAPPVAAVTAIFDNDVLVPESIQCWRPHALALTETAVVHHFAVADVPFKDWSERRVVRMAFVHAIPAAKKQDSKDELTPPPPPDEILAVDPAPFEPPFARGDEGKQRVAQLFLKLQSALLARHAKLREPIPDTLSRERRRVASIRDCEVAWRPPLRKEGEVLRIAAGSCRYSGMMFDGDRVDRTLAEIDDLRGTAAAPDLMLMLGDQIYADATAGVFDVDARVERFTSRYDSAFGTKHFRRLTSSVPTYMLADDHEIRDGWPNDTPPGPPKRPDYWDNPADWGRLLFLSHQRSHGPTAPTGLQPVAGRTSLCFSFDAYDCTPFFALDGRFDRLPDRRQIVGPEQLKAFKSWLRDLIARGDRMRYVPKFVVSGSVLAPGLVRFEDYDEYARRADTWQAYPGERAEAAELIAESGLENVVLLSGDYHCSAAGRIRFCRRDGGASQGYMIVVPPLYAPFPFANAQPHEISRQGTIRCTNGGRIVATYEAEPEPGEGFALITLRHDAAVTGPDAWRIEVRLLGETFTASVTLSRDGCLRWKRETKGGAALPRIVERAGIGAL